MAVVFVCGAIYGFLEYINHRDRLDAIISRPGPVSITTAELGLIGDSFGSVNSLLSLLTVSGLAISFLIQFAVLLTDHQSDEANDRRHYLQSFETSFYNLLNLFIETREVFASDDLNTGQIIKGRGAVVAATVRLSKALHSHAAGRELDKEAARGLIREWAKIGKAHNPNTFRQGFLLLKSLLNSIDRLKSTYANDSVAFVDIINAILSVEERVFLYAYAVGTQDQELKSLIKNLEIFPSRSAKELNLSEALLRFLEESIAETGLESG